MFLLHSHMLYEVRNGIRVSKDRTDIVIVFFLSFSISVRTHEYSLRNLIELHVKAMITHDKYFVFITSKIDFPYV